MNQKWIDQELAQALVSFFQADVMAREATQSVWIACRTWALSAGLKQVPVEGEEGYEQMREATRREHEHHQRMLARKKASYSLMMRRAAAAIGACGSRWGQPDRAEIKEKLEQIERQREGASDGQKLALDKRRLEVALSGIGISRNVAQLVCKDFFVALPECENA